MFLKSLVFVLLISSFSQALPYGQQKSTSTQYIHGNDTIQATLIEGSNLHVRPGSTQTLIFEVTNHHNSGQFQFKYESEDGIRGVITESFAYIQQGQTQRVELKILHIPERPVDSRLKLTLHVERLDGRGKREAAPQSGGSGGNNYNGNPNNNRLDLNDLFPAFNNPSYRKEIYITVEFVIIDENEDFEDNREPTVDLTYGADDKSETCQADEDDYSCQYEYWWTTYKIQDEKSGLHEIQFTSTGGSYNGEGNGIFYRYENFALGTDGEYIVTAQASCCLKGIVIRVTDIAGNEREVTARNGGTGSPMSPGLKWGLIGGGIAVGLIIIAVVCYLAFGKKYRPVSTN